MFSKYRCNHYRTIKEYISSLIKVSTVASQYLISTDMISERLYNNDFFKQKR